MVNLGAVNYETVRLYALDTMGLKLLPWQLQSPLLQQAYMAGAMAVVGAYTNPDNGPDLGEAGVQQPLGEPQEQQEGHQADDGGPDPRERRREGDFLDHPPDDGHRQERDHEQDEKLDHTARTQPGSEGS
jgi:hypothetical protein